MNARIAMAAALVLSPSFASAYESQCRVDVGGAPSDLKWRLDESVCVLPDEPNQPFDGAECPPGLEAARGAQLGEHAYLTWQAMRLAGLPDLTYAYHGDPNNPVLEYYTAGRNVPGSSVSSLEPTGPGAMLKKVRRPTAIPEFANLPDVSYSMFDFVLGNEHCAAFAGVPPKRSTVELLNTCHTFATHMGLLNSNHFLPQGQAMYELYHGIALDVAKRCRALREAFPSKAAAPHPLTSFVAGSALACDREALAFEAVAAHYIEDAWSTGHMFNGWGSPVFEDMRFPDEIGDPSLDGTRSLVVAGIRGVIHGVRSLARLQLPSRVRGFQHDQMCLPGLPNPQGSADEKIPVRFRHAGSAAGAARIHEGGGDLYLLPCTARGQDPQGAILTGSTLGFQRSRLLSCTARGFEAVFDETLPPADRKRVRDPAASATLAAELTKVGENDVTSSLQEECWSQRATNESMSLGLGVTGVLDDPARVARFVVGPAGVGSLSLAGQSLMATVGVELRFDLTVLSELLKWRRRANPKGTEAAQTMQSFMGIRQNSDYQSRITDGKVPYLEARDVASWSAEPSKAGCTDDVMCFGARAVNEGRYCGRTGPGVSDLRCVPKEAALLHAFRRAELPAWCAQETKESIGRAVKSCVESGSASSDACEACVEVLLPHHRDACSATEFKKLPGGIDGKGKDHRSVCDVLLERGAIKSAAGSLDATSVYVPIGGGKIRDEVRRHCFGRPPSDASCGEGTVIFTDNSHRVAAAAGDCCVTSSGFCTNTAVTFEKEGAFDPSDRIITKMPALLPGESRQYTTWAGAVPYMAGSVEATASRPTHNRYSVRIRLKGLPNTPSTSDIKSAMLASPRCAGLNPPATEVQSYTATTTVVPDLRVTIELQIPVGFRIVFTGTGTLDYKKNGQCATRASCFVTLGGLHDGKVAYTSCMNNTEATQGQQPISCTNTGLVSYSGTIWLVVALRMESSPGAIDALQSGAASSCKDTVASDIAVDFDLIPPPP
jgi:hypothetical protein